MSALLMMLFACGEKSPDTGEASNPEDSAVTTEPEPDDAPGEPDDTPAPSYDIGAELSRFIGCGDLYSAAVNETDSWALTVVAVGQVQAAFDAGAPQILNANLSAPVGEAEVKLSFGQNLTHAFCNDALDPGIEIVVEKEYLPVSGQLQLSISPTGEATSWGELPADAMISINDARFCVSDSDCVNVSSLTFTVAVGWLAG